MMNNKYKPMPLKEVINLNIGDKVRIHLFRSDWNEVQIDYRVQFVTSKEGNLISTDDNMEYAGWEWDFGYFVTRKEEWEDNRLQLDWGDALFFMNEK